MTEMKSDHRSKIQLSVDATVILVLVDLDERSQHSGEHAYLAHSLVDFDLPQRGEDPHEAFQQAADAFRAAALQPSSTPRTSIAEMLGS